MRFVARLVIAIATLLSSAWLCWGQTPSNAGQRFAGTRQVSQPSLAPPSSEGTWVADDDLAESPPGPPEQLGIEYDSVSQIDGQPDSQYGDEYGDEYGGECDGSCGDECDGSCGANCDPNAGRKHGCGLLGSCCGPLWCSDMWNEVHAHRRIFAQTDFLAFWTKGNPLPPLVTTSPPGTVQADAGRLPESATTAILFGNTRVDDSIRYGGRLNVGYWLVDGEFWGVEGQYFALQPGNTTFNAASNGAGDPILARPFLNVDPGLLNPVQDAALISFPNPFQIGQGNIGTLTGNVSVRTNTNLQSAGALLRKLVWIDFTVQRRLDLLLGYRFLRLDDSVQIDDSSTYIRSSGQIPDNTFTSQDIFSSKNIFNGGEFGLKYQSNHGRLSLELIGKCAFGNNQQITYINGSNTRVSGSSSVTNSGGLLTQASNIGTHERNVFAILPEADANLRWDITCNLRATFGYTFVYINRVQRSGSAINTTLNPTQINGGTLIGEAQPNFVAHDDTYWAHGATAGVEYRW